MAKTIMITGAGSGLGKGTAIDPAARSAKLTDEAERALLEDCKKIIDAITYVG